MTDKSFSLRNKRVFVAGHRGMVGAALVRALCPEECEIFTIGRQALDLRRQAAVEAWMAEHRPEVVVIAAARVGGIGVNAACPADFLYDNLMIEANVIHAAHECGVERLLFLGSSCIYPKDAPQPIQEGALMTGPLEPTNEAYAIAKIAGIKLCQSYRTQHGRSFISAMPCNLYGPGDAYDENNSHVIPALLMKMRAARDAGAPFVELWGTGTPLREFLHVDDLARAMVLLLRRYDGAEPVNIGSGEELSIAALAGLVARVTGYEGEIRFDATRPDGTKRKVMECAKIRALGWSPSIPLEAGLRDVCAVRDDRWDAA